MTPKKKHLFSHEMENRVQFPRSAASRVGSAALPPPAHPACPRRCPSVNSRPASQPSQASPQQTQHRQDTAHRRPESYPNTHPGAMRNVGGGTLGKRTWAASTVGYLAGLEHSLHRMSICGESSISFATRILFILGMLACVDSMRENDLLGARAERCLAPCPSSPSTQSISMI